MSKKSAKKPVRTPSEWGDHRECGDSKRYKTSKKKAPAKKKWE